MQTNYLAPFRLKPCMGNSNGQWFTTTAIKKYPNSQIHVIIILVFKFNLALRHYKLLCITCKCDHYPKFSWYATEIIVCDFVKLLHLDASSNLLVVIDFLTISVLSLKYLRRSTNSCFNWPRIYQIDYNVHTDMVYTIAYIIWTRFYCGLLVVIICLFCGVRVIYPLKLFRIFPMALV